MYNNRLVRDLFVTLHRLFGTLFLAELDRQTHSHLCGFVKLFVQRSEFNSC